MAAPPSPDDIDGDPAPSWIGYLLLAIFVALVLVILFVPNIP